MTQSTSDESGLIQMKRFASLALPTKRPPIAHPAWGGFRQVTRKGSRAPFAPRAGPFAARTLPSRMIINQINLKTSFSGKAQESGMVNVFLYGASSTVMDFILLGRNSGVQAALRRIPAKNTFGEIIGRFDKSEDSMAALVRHMDDITDAKIVREAEVYRMTLVGCE